MNWSFLSTDIVVEEAQLDICAVLADVHRASFPRGWTADELVRLIQDKTVLCYICRRPATFFRPATKEPKAFVLARVAADEAEILTIAVAPDARELGLGRALMQRVMDQLYADRVTHLFLEVDENNRGALALYRGLGFVEVGERKGYYSDGSVQTNNEEGRQDRARALVMRCDLS